VVSGPPSILSWLADELTDDDRRRIPARLVLTGGETLTPQMRGQIERGFGLPVADVYGSHEVVFIAMQRPRRPEYRVCEEAVVIEVLRDGAPALPGETGEIVVTALQSFAMPFIRYRLGDRVALGEAPGGSAGPYTTLRSIEGRTIDRFILPDGRALHGYALGEAVEESGLRVRRFQIIQERRDAFRIALVLYEPPRGELERLASRIREILGPAVTVHLDIGPALRPTGSRKFYPFVSFERLSAWGAGHPR
jgi:phenylacetate-CoA ligase